MKIIPCPQNGPRPVSEFTFSGAVEEDKQDTRHATQNWAEEVFFKENGTGVVKELWRHNPSAFWLYVERCRVTDRIVNAWPAIANDKLTGGVQSDRG